MMMAASICSLIFDFTSEDALLKQPGFDGGSLDSLGRIIARSLPSSGQVCDVSCTRCSLLLKLSFYDSLMTDDA